ncbi:hypothetical protein QYS49_32595 [Marivirga salinae]|uniref:Uncharacterized protein n=1 Tax=Marivirga salinarum TaxID=3059078 RepID=A0AA51NE06_9BACT|nr:hypothetical protein [Marivirga sp. BDSF4-3]WMN12146.1 hypothetical protein QYS49_32595 [Marivirga sp. BDSF4-3]
MDNENLQKEKVPFRKGFIAIIVLAIALFGLYNSALYFLNFLGLI